jgi:hypothetical protein
MNKCADCGSTEAIKLRGDPDPYIWLCWQCLAKRVNAPENIARSLAAEDLAEFLKEGGKPS